MTKPTIEELRLFAEHHILAARKGRRGQILEVKHATEGWMTTDAYVERQHLHEVAVRSIAPMIEGGYRMKQALWNISAGIAGSNIPLGPLIPLATLWAIEEIAADPTWPDRVQTIGVLTGSLLMPFGDVWIMKSLVDAAQYLGWGSLNPITLVTTWKEYLKGAALIPTPPKFGRGRGRPGLPPP